MKALGPLALASLLLAAACRVEPTPEEYFDFATSAQDEREASAAEVRDRILAMGQALGRRSAGDALLALAPARDVYLAGPEPGAEWIGTEGVGAALSALAQLPEPVQTREVVVTVGSGGGVAWFRARLDSQGDQGGAVMRMTGLYRLNEGLWQLAQAHLSPATPPPAPPSSPEESAADSAAAE